MPTVSQLNNRIRELHFGQHCTDAFYFMFRSALYNSEGRSKRAVARRAFLGKLLDNYPRLGKPTMPNAYTRQEKRRKAEGLARAANMHWDEHGSSRGDYRRTIGLDYVPPSEAKGAPFFDMGGAGLAVIEVQRTRYYAKSYDHGPSTASSFFLVGRNEAGTFFSHAIPRGYGTVKDALSWIWNGRENDIIARQGDVALIQGNGGPRLPANLPSGHVVFQACDLIVHRTHPAIPVPGKGQRVIVGRRASERVAAQTRD